MLCGKFKEDLTVQLQVNDVLAQVSNKIVKAKRVDGKKYSEIKPKLPDLLRHARKCLKTHFQLTIEPKVILKDFNYKKFTVFSSKKIPLKLKAINS